MKKIKRSTYFWVAAIAALGGVIMKLLAERENRNAFLPDSDGDGGAAPLCEAARLRRVYRFHGLAGIFSALSLVSFIVFSAKRNQKAD